MKGKKWLRTRKILGQKSLKGDYVSLLRYGWVSTKNIHTFITAAGKMNAAKYREILKDSQIQSTLQSEWRLIFQQDNDPKHTAKATQKWNKDNNVNVLEWLSQSPDLSPIQNLCLDLKRDVQARSTCSLTDPEQF